jgi:hypothetical protein
VEALGNSELGYVVILLWWIGSNVYAIAKKGEPAQDPDDRRLTWREHWIISKRPDHAGVSGSAVLTVGPEGWHHRLILAGLGLCRALVRVEPATARFA